MEEDKHIITPAKKNIFKDLSSLKQKAKESVKSTFYSVPLPPSEAPASAQKSKPLFSKEKNEKIVTFWLASMLIVVMGIGIFFSFKAQQSNQKQKGLSLKKPTTSPAKPPTTLALSPTPDKTLNWKTYRNEKYGFLLMYPENFFSKEYTPSTKSGEAFGVSFADKKWESPVVHNPSLTIRVITTNLSPQEWLEENFDSVIEPSPGNFQEPPFGYLNVQDTSINGMAAIKFQFLATSDSSISTIVRGKSGTLYRIDAISSGLGNFPSELYDQILSTFQFLE